jgi:TRAP-type C4-dicarboxylate transport system permease small subunit
MAKTAFLRASARISQIDRLLGRAEDVVAAALMVILAAAVLLDTFQRFANVGLAYMSNTEELARLLLVWITFLGAALAYRRQEHLSFSSGAGSLGGGAKLVVTIVQEALIGSFLVLFATQCVALVKDQAALETPALGWSGSVFGIPLLVSACLTLIHFVARLASLLAHEFGSR